MKLTQEQVGDHIVVRLQGRLDISGVSEHREALMAVADSAKKWFILNLQGVDLIDSTGLGLIVSLVKRTREHKADLAICGLSPQAQSLFELTRMTKIMSIHPSEKAALTVAG